MSKIDDILKTFDSDMATSQASDTPVSDQHRGIVRAKAQLSALVDEVKPEPLTPQDPRMKTDYANGFNDGMNEYQIRLHELLGETEGND